MADEITNLVYRPDFQDGQNDTQFGWSTQDNYGYATALPVTEDYAQLGPKAGSANQRGGTITAPMTAGEDYTLILDVELAGDTEIPGLNLYADTGVGYYSNEIGTVPATAGRQTAVITFNAPKAYAAIMWKMTGGTTALAKAYTRFYGARLSPGSEIVDEIGIFSGSTADTADYAYTWAGQEYGSISIATPAGDPGPGPGPGDMVSRVLTLAGVIATDATTATATESVNLVTAMVKAYTRGKGFNTDDAGAMTPNDELGAVIVTAATRLVANPSQLEYSAGTETVRSAFAGWTLAETFVLNSYRKRWA